MSLGVEQQHAPSLSQRTTPGSLDVGAEQSATGKAPDFKRKPRGPKSAGLSAVVVLLFSSPETVRRAHSSASVEHQFAAKATGVLLRVHAMELGGVVSLTTRVPRSGTLLRYASK